MSFQTDSDRRIFIAIWFNGDCLTFARMQPLFAQMGVPWVSSENYARTLKSLPPVSKATWIFDSTLPGFGLKQQPTGKASYIVSFRIRGSRTKRTVTLGPITTLSPEQARERARLIIAAAREGRDLNSEGRERAQKLDAERRALAHRMTVSSAAETFLAEMGRLDSPQTGRPAAATSVAATRARLRRLIERHGDCAIADLDRARCRSYPRSNAGEEQAQCLWRDHAASDLGKASRPCHDGGDGRSRTTAYAAAALANPDTR